MKKYTALMFTAVLLALCTASTKSVAETCDPGIIYVATLENKAIRQIDKFWGRPEDIGKTTAGILAHVLLTDTGTLVAMAGDADGIPVSSSTDPKSAAKSLLDGKQGCFVAFGSIDRALVYAHNVYKFKPTVSAGVSTKRQDDSGDKDWYDYLSENVQPGHIRRKLKIETASHLYLYDRRSDSIVIDMTIDGKHETSVKEYESTDKDKRITLSSNPSEASGSQVGIPFVRMFDDFAKAASNKIK